MSILRRIALAGAISFCALWGSGSMAQDKVELKVGDKAPVFQGTDDAGKVFKSSDVVGKKIVVVYFFPAAFTGG